MHVTCGEGTCLHFISIHVDQFRHLTVPVYKLHSIPTKLLSNRRKRKGCQEGRANRDSTGDKECFIEMFAIKAVKELQNITHLLGLDFGDYGLEGLFCQCVNENITFSI